MLDPKTARSAATPLLFFINILHHVLSQDFGIIVSALISGRVIASAIFFHLGPIAIFKYAVSDIDYLRHRPNSLVMWEAIKWFRERGARSLSLGRTEGSNQGLRRFKLAWGASERALNYYRYELDRAALFRTPLRGEHPRKFFSMTPIPVLRLLGRFLYKHVG